MTTRLQSTTTPSITCASVSAGNSRTRLKVSKIRGLSINLYYLSVVWSYNTSENNFE